MQTVQPQPVAQPTLQSNAPTMESRQWQKATPNTETSNSSNSSSSSNSKEEASEEGVTLQVQVVMPCEDEQGEGGHQHRKYPLLKGQTLLFSMTESESVETLKQRIESVVSLPPNKQKLRAQGEHGAWLKNDAPLAEYARGADNMSFPILELTMRTRGRDGGKRKK